MVPIGSFLRWLSSTAGYVPGNEAQLSLSDLLTTSGSSLVVATRFYPGAQKTLRSSWQAFRLQLRASLATANRSAFALSQSLTTPFAVPLLVSKTVILVTGAFIPKTSFRSNFLCVLFFDWCFFALFPLKLALTAGLFWVYNARKPRSLFYPPKEIPMNPKSPRIFFAVITFAFGCFAVTQAQTVATTPSPSPAASPIAAPSPGPDQKAYDEARRVKDPQKKIEALEKIIKDFPERFTAFQARNDILDTVIKNFPTQTDRIKAAAERYLTPTPGFGVVSSSNYITVAAKLMEAGLMLDWAEELARKGAAQYEDENAKQMRRQRARYEDTLGRIYLKQGRIKEAKTHLKLALTNDPELTTTLVALGQIAEQGRHHKEALEYFSAAAVKSALRKPDRQLMETAYRATHKDSLAGLEDLLDDKYRKLNAGIRFDHYQASSKRTNRIALAELFTGSGCGPCVAADLGFDGLLERYSRKDLVVLVYHLHIPLPDPMTNPATVERGKYYTVPGTPTSVVDGIKLSGGGGSRDMTKGFFDRVNPKIESELESPAQAQITLTGTVEGDLVKANVTVDEVKTPSVDLKLQIALTEEEVRYTGENGIRFHPMVVRSLGGKDANGFALTGSAPTKVEWTFDVKAMSSELKKYLDSYEQQGHRGDTFTFSEKKFQIDPNKLSLVAFVQNMKTKEILQTVYIKLSPAATASAQTNAN